MSKAPGKPLFSLAETFRILYHAIQTMPYMARGERKGLLSPILRERLMIAVTEVNGCAMCSYAHARMALESGMRQDEIRNMLEGELHDVPPDEMTAILFAQHYADARCVPDRAAWDKLCSQYGRDAALAMLGAIRAITAGNAFGIPSGSLLRRMGVKRFHVDSRSTPAYEIAMLLAMFLFPIPAMLPAFIARLLRLPVELPLREDKPESR